ncbi:MAG: GMP synthase [Gammaproteobacteria bacterium]|nr:GMP synthase [Gammaproteobacteria bacterium]
MIVGVLQADSVLPQFQEEHGNYPEMFIRILSIGPDIEFRIYDVERGVYPEDLDECDGYVITGSKKSVYDDEPWIKALIDFVRRLHENQKKVVGICFGHQMVAHALGGRTEPAREGWEVGIHQCQIVNKLDFMSPDLDEFGLLVSHKDQVTELPDGAELLATSEFCPNAMFRIDDHILTFQGHPEFTRAYARDLMEMREEILGEKTFQAGIASLGGGLDGDLVGSWIIRFIAQPSQAPISE